jgi:hypothetical protein
MCKCETARNIYYVKTKDACQKVENSCTISTLFLDWFCILFHSIGRPAKIIQRKELMALNM